MTSPYTDKHDSANPLISEEFFFYQRNAGSALIYCFDGSLCISYIIGSLHFSINYWNGSRRQPEISSHQDAKITTTLFLNNASAYTLSLRWSYLANINILREMNSVPTFTHLALFWRPPRRIKINASGWCFGESRCYAGDIRMKFGKTFNADILTFQR